jgi:putative solute:sodium symporter small subunit
LTDRHTGFRELIMTWKKVLGWLVVIFLVWFLVTNPTGAAAAVTNLLNALKSVGNSLATFFTSL